MKNTFSTLILFFFANLLTAQTDTTQFRKPENLRSAANFHIAKSLELSESHHHYHQAACYLALLENTDSAFLYIRKAIEHGAKGEDILTDTDFKQLHNNPLWNQIIADLNKRYLSQYPNITRPDLAVELWHIWIDDQRFRTLARNIKERPKEIVDSGIFKRIERVEQIITQHGWPTFTMVGKQSAEAVFLVIQHSMKIKKYLPLMIQAAKQGEADIKRAAMMIDRHLSGIRRFGNRNPVQIFGTQYSSLGTRDKQTGKATWTAYKIDPIADEENVNFRRKAIGLESIEEFCKKRKIQYISPTERPDYKPIKIKNRWIRKGYLLGTNPQR